ncbi:hypothetical protein ACSBR2_038831 [Camellia fascicularis]
MDYTPSNGDDDNDDDEDPISGFLPSQGASKGLRKKYVGCFFGEAKACIQNDELSIINLINKFMNRQNWGDWRFQHCKRNTLCIYLLTQFLIVPSNGIVSPLLVDVAKQVSQDKGFVGLVLAETLMGLDAIHDGETVYFAGSPLLLQLVTMNTVDDWHNWMYSRTYRVIAWHCPWLMLPMMTREKLHFSGMELVILTRATYYFPLRLLQ